MPSLLDSIKVGDLRLPNRIIMAPLTRARATPDARVPLPAFLPDWLGAGGVQAAAVGRREGEDMPIVHQDHGFDFVIKAEDKEPPKVHITGAGGKYLLVRVGIPGQEYPYIEKYENVDQDEVNWVWDTISDYQENFLLGWKRIHGGEWKTTRGPVKLGARIEPAAGDRLRLKPKINKDRLKELIGGISDKRFYRLQKLLIWDIDKADFKSISLVLYLRLGGWSHTGGTYSSTMGEVRALCEAMFGYQLPEKIGKVFFKVHRYHSPATLAKIALMVREFHEKKIR